MMAPDDAQAQQPPGAGSQAAVAGEAAALRISVPGLEPVLAQLRLRPGAPVGLRLLAGHPFSEQVSLVMSI